MSIVTLRGIEYEITDVKVAPAEPDVGIFNSYPDGYTLIGPDGKEVSTDFYNSLTAEEHKIIDPIVEEIAANKPYDDDY